MRERIYHAQSHVGGVQVAGMLTVERGIEATKVGSQETVRLVGEGQQGKGIRADERREWVHARKFLCIDRFRVVVGHMKPAFRHSPRSESEFERVEYRKAWGRGVMGYIPRSIYELSSLSDRAISFLRLCGPRNHVREGSLKFLNEFVVWLLLRVVSVGEKRGHQYSIL